MAATRSAVLLLVGPLRTPANCSKPAVSPRSAAPVASAARYTCSDRRSVRPARSVAAPVSTPWADAAWPLCAVVTDWFCSLFGAAVSSLLSSPQAAPRTDSMARAATAAFDRLVLNSCMMCFPLIFVVEFGGRSGGGDDSGHRRRMDGAIERVGTGLGKGELEGLPFGDVPGVEFPVGLGGGRSAGLFHPAGRHGMGGHVVLPPGHRSAGGKLEVGRRESDQLDRDGRAGPGRCGPGRRGLGGAGVRVRCIAGRTGGTGEGKERRADRETEGVAVQWRKSLVVKPIPDEFKAGVHVVFGAARSSG